MKFFKAFYLLPLFLFGAVNQKGDTQVWQRISCNKKLSQNVNLLVLQETRFGDDVSEFYYAFVQALVSYSVYPWLSIAPGYRQIYKRSPLSSSHFRPEYSPMMDVSFKTHIKDFELVNRNRVQYLIFHSNHYPWVYRNLTRLKSPWKWTRFAITPYVEDELFFREGVGFQENRATIGFLKKFSNSVSLDLFYIARLIKVSNDWNYNNVIGVKLNFSK